MKQIVARKLVTVLLSGIALITVGCGYRVEVPTAHIGKVITDKGMEDDIKYPSSFRLPVSFLYKPKLVVSEVSDKALEETLQVFIPKDKLNLTADLRGTVSISSDPKNVNLIFNKITPQEVSDRILKIPAETVYRTYAQQVIRSVGRSVLTKYTIAEIMNNRDSISEEIFQETRKKLESSPIQISRLGLADIQPPAVIVKAQETAKEREIEIMKAEADKQIELAQADARLEVARKQQEVDLLEAETQVLVEKKLNESVNAAFVTQRALKAMQELVKSDNSTIVFLPYEAMTNPAMMIGALNESFSNQTEKNGK